MLGARRRFHIQKFLYCLAIAQPVGDRSHVIHAVDVGIEHRVSTMLTYLLDAAVQVADDAFETENFFAIEAENHAQHAVRCGMLRAHIDDELVGIKKRLLGSFEIEMRERAVRVGHYCSTGCTVQLAVSTGNFVFYWPLSIPRLICTHSLSCWRMP